MSTDLTPTLWPAGVAGDPPPAAAVPPRRPFGPADAVVAVCLAAVAFALYAQTRHFEFIHYDDQAYVKYNPYVIRGLTWAGVRYAMTASIVANWHPFTVLVSLALSSAFGPSAATFHTANAVLHAVGVGLLFAFLRTATGRAGPAAAVAALWGLHPLRVESVAWIAELKDELSVVTWLGCLLAYVAYARRRSPGRYAAVAGLLVLALTSKPTTVVLPFVLLLCDVWPLGGDRPAGRSAAGRWWAWRVGEKVPFALAAVAVVVIGIRGQASMAALVKLPATVRVENALASVAVYVRQVFWPAGLGVFYPHPALLGRPVPAGQVLAGALLVVGVTAATLTAVRRRPYLAVGWLWFLAALVPVIGLLQAGQQAHADRFTLLPSMGLTVAVVWLVADWAGAGRGRRAAAVTAGVAAAAALATATAELVPTWHDPVALWARADAVIPDDFVARSFRSAQALEAGDIATAERLARETVAMGPEAGGDGHVALANVLAARGPRYEAEAVKEFDTAVRLAPGTPFTHYQAGVFLVAIGHHDAAARRQFEIAVRMDPTFLLSRRALGVVLGRLGQYAGAAEQLRAVLAMTPGDGPAEGDLADALRAGGDPLAARPHYAAAIAAGQRRSDWEAELAWLSAEDAGTSPQDLAPLARTAQDACEQTGNRDPFPLYADSLVLARLGRFDDAVAAGERALAAARQTGQADMARAIAGRLAAYRVGLPATRPAAPPAGPGTVNAAGPSTAPVPPPAP